MMASESLWENTRYFSSQLGVARETHGFLKMPQCIALLQESQRKLTWTVPLQCTQTASGQSLWTPETEIIFLSELNSVSWRWTRAKAYSMYVCVFFFFLYYLIWVQQAVVDSELHKLGEQIQYLSLQGHRGAGSVLLQRFDHQRLKQTNVVVDGILEKTKMRPELSEQQHLTRANEERISSIMENIWCLEVDLQHILFSCLQSQLKKR